MSINQINIKIGKHIILLMEKVTKAAERLLKTQPFGT